MAFTYDDTAIATATSVSRLRFLVGDTDELLALLTDAECSALITVYATADAAAIPALDRMIAKQSQRVDWKSGAESETQSQRLAALRELKAGMAAQSGYDDTSAAVVTNLTRTNYYETDE